MESDLTSTKKRVYCLANNMEKRESTLAPEVHSGEMVNIYSLKTLNLTDLYLDLGKMNNIKFELRVVAQKLGY